MAESHPVAFINGSGHPIVAHPEVVTTPESLIELAKNTLGPVRCEWEAGTKDECGIILGSWTLLCKHLRVVHGWNTKKEDFHCALPKCNQQFHSSYASFVEHLDAGHLVHLMFCCPLSGCRDNSLQGIKSLRKHLETKHSHNTKGKASSYPVNPETTWMPFTWPQLLASTSETASHCSVASATSHKAKSRIGTILVSSMEMKQSQKMTEWIQEDAKEWLPSQQTTMSQSQGLMGSQLGLHLVMRRKRQARQLEKVKEIMREDEDEDEGVAKVTLDDLKRFDAERDLGGTVDVDVDGQEISIIGRRREMSVGSLSQQEGSKDAKLIQKADCRMVIGQAMKQLMVDLSQPQPMPTLEELSQSGGEYPESARAPKSITFEVMQRKLDELKALGVVEIDPDRLLHDPTL